jgi:hypothetical protein
LKSLDVLLSGQRDLSGKPTLFATHGAMLIVLFASFLPFFGQKKTFAESTLKVDNNDGTLLCDLARVLAASGTETVRVLRLCLNDSWLIERVRGSLFRAARGRREDFVEADDSFGKALPGIVLCRMGSR